MYHGPCTVYHVGNLASSARRVAEQEQGEFLNRRSFVSGKVYILKKLRNAHIINTWYMSKRIPNAFALK